MFTQQQKDYLLALIERVDEISACDVMRSRAAHWQRYQAGIPASSDPQGPLYTVDLGIPTWARLLQFDINQYFTDIFTQIDVQLRMRIFQFEHFDDDTLVGPGIGVSPLGTALEPAVLGVPITYQPDTVPWAERSVPVISSPAELANRPQPDFYTAGPMPLLHRMYAEAVELMDGLTGGRWKVSFPAAIRGILGLAQTLRGPHENILIDMLEQPDFAHQIMRYVLDFRIHFARERARFLHEPVGLGHIGNDEVTVPVVSPAIYRDFLLPYETELCRFHNGLSCWHSCGDTGPLAKLIRQIPDIRQFYTGPWTDLHLVMEAFGTATPLDVAVHVVDDVLAASPEQMRSKIERVIEICGNAPLKLRAGSIDSVFGLEEDIRQARTWAAVARGVVTGCPEQHRVS